MNKMLAVSTLAVLGLGANAFAGGLPEEMPVAPCAASDAGVYIGVSGGLGLTHYKQWDVANKSVSKDRHFTTRAFLGYDINRFFAVEFGYTAFFGKPKVEMRKKKTDGAWEVTNFELRTNHAFDLMGKIKAPVMENLDLYGKLGMSYFLGSKNSAENKFDNNHSFNLAFGAGLDYAVTPNVIVNAEWLRFNGDSDADRQQPFGDAFLIGVRYKFEL